MADTLAITVHHQLTGALRTEMLALCSAAYEEDFEASLAPLLNPVHVVGRRGGMMVCHAAWVERWLEPAGQALLRTAYVEAVATLPACQGQGLGTAIMSALPPLLGGFDIAALSPSETGFYARLGWESWRGPLAVRTADGQVASEDEEVMILRLPLTPPLDLESGLSIEERAGEVW